MEFLSRLPRGVGPELPNSRSTPEDRRDTRPVLSSRYSDDRDPFLFSNSFPSLGRKSGPSFPSLGRKSGTSGGPTRMIETRATRDSTDPQGETWGQRRGHSTLIIAYRDPNSLGQYVPGSWSKPYNIDESPAIDNTNLVLHEGKVKTPGKPPGRPTIRGFGVGPCSGLVGLVVVLVATERDDLLRPSVDRPGSGEAQETVG